MKQVFEQILIATIKVVSFLIPHWLLYRLSDLAYVILYYGVKYRRKVVYENLRRSFPEKAEAEIDQIARRFYRHFCDMMLETFKVFTLSEKQVLKRYHLENPELLQPFYDQGKSVIAYVAHYSNWEYLISLVLVLPSFKASTFYQRLSNPFVEKLMRSMRERYGLSTIELKQSFRTLLNYQKEGVLTYTFIFGDQSPTKKSGKHWTTFLHQDTAFLVGAERIARKLNMAVVYPVMYKVKRGYYRLSFQILSEDAGQEAPGVLIEKYAKALEENIQIDPALWLWSHRRWKLKKPLEAEA